MKKFFGKFLVMFSVCISIVAGTLLTAFGLYYGFRILFDVSEHNGVLATIILMACILFSALYAYLEKDD